MKNQIKQLTPSYMDLKEEKEIYMRTFRKLEALERWMKSNFPDNIKGQYSFSCELGETCTRVFIYLNKDEKATIEVLKWISKLKNKRLKCEKFWREEQGAFAYKIERAYGYFSSFIIFIEQAANIDGCVIKKKTVKKEVFYTDCETERVII